MLFLYDAEGTRTWKPTICFWCNMSRDLNRTCPILCCICLNWELCKGRSGRSNWPRQYPSFVVILIDNCSYLKLSHIGFSDGGTLALPFLQLATMIIFTKNYKKDAVPFNTTSNSPIICSELCLLSIHTRYEPGCTLQLNKNMRLMFERNLKLSNSVRMCPK